ncbi:MAG: arsenate reductase [Mariprofundaceae bacterium]
MLCRIYGVPNCDTMKKARAWLAELGIDAVFHNYKKDGVSTQMLSAWCTRLDWEVLLNKRGTSWRRLPESARMDINKGKAIELMAAHPSLIKRPVLDVDGQLHAGFSSERYSRIFSS